MSKPPSWPPKGIPQQFAVGLLIGVVGSGVLALGCFAVVRTFRPDPVAAAPMVAAPPVAPIAPIVPPLEPTPSVPVIAASPAPTPVAAPAAAPAPARLILADVELVDCVESGAPAWCRQVRAATKSERAGTVVAVVRSSVAGDVFACSRGRHIGRVEPGGYMSDSLRKKLGARVIARGDSSRWSCHAAVLAPLR